MNFFDLKEACWRFLGFPDTNAPNARTNWRTQEIRDALNTAQDEIFAANPYIWHLTRESTIQLLSGTNYYFLDDFASRPVSIWTADVSAHKVRFRNPRIADRDGSRNTAAAYGTLGPYELTWAPRNTAPAKSGTLALALNGSTVTAAAGSSAFDATDVGRMIRFNGEDGDYKVQTFVSATSVTLDKSVVSRQIGIPVAAPAGYLVGQTWIIGPPGRYQLQILPKPTAARALNYRFLALPRRLLADQDQPELPIEHHHLVWKGALRWISAINEDSNSYQRFMQEYQTALELFKSHAHDDVDGEDSPWFETLTDQHAHGLPVDASFRQWRNF